ncbi:hypothetical protein GW7_05560 [Heterocephalus glaber]|uniref:D-glutamate cyclase-like C-terminal domain-containing protein n=1 Tax=Heterocephalus glaber TaxID=10181 RepID=G5AZZ6_HETGA|nr:hypothetical protein GW7_05560 [Heterocephalus glaber]
MTPTAAFSRGHIQEELPLRDRRRAAVLGSSCSNGLFSTTDDRRRFDHGVATACAGRAADGNYYNARKRNVKHSVDHVDDLFLAAQKIPGISSTGVSNWGSYALACALYILNSCETHGPYLRKAVGPSRAPEEQSWTQALLPVIKEEKMLGILVQHKVQSAVSGIMGMEVDGLPFPGVHAVMIQKLMDITTGHV